MKYWVCGLLIIGIVSPVMSGDATEIEKYSYALGVDLGRQVNRQQQELSREMLLKGFEDTIKGNAPLFDENELRDVKISVRQAEMEKRNAERRKQAEENLTAGKQFLEENGRKEGVVTLSSGLQYKILKEGSGESPSRSDKVRVHYRGTLINGSEFDSSYKRNAPSEFGVNQVIKGWSEALQLMNPGSHWQLYIPSELAYSERGMGQVIEPNSVLIFDVELLEVLK